MTFFISSICLNQKDQQESLGKVTATEAKEQGQKELNPMMGFNVTVF